MVSCMPSEMTFKRYSGYDTLRISAPDVWEA